jgi:hypothetical protein
MEETQATIALYCPLGNGVWFYLMRWLVSNIIPMNQRKGPKLKEIVMHKNAT